MLLLHGRRLDLSDRRTTLAIAAAALAVVAAGAALAIGTGNFGLLSSVAAIALGPLLLLAAIRWPYVFPFGAYAVLVPFDQVLTLPGAGSVTRYLGLLTTVFVAVYALRTKRLNRPPVSLYLWLAFLLWVMIGLFRSVDMANAQATFQAAALLILMFAVLATAPISERQLRFACAATVVGGVVAALYGLYLFQHDPELLAGMDSRATVNLMGKALDANAYADALLAPFALALVFLLHARTPLKLLGSLGALAIVSAAIVASLSREALLSCAVIIAVTVWFSRRRLLGIALAVPAFVLLPIAVPSVVARLQDAFKTGGAGRTSIWEVDWTAFLAHPVVGWGTGNSIEAYNKNFLAVFQAYNAGWSRPPHNTALFMAVELGIVGVVLFYAAWFSAFGSFAGIRRGDSLYGLRVGLTASLVALLVAGFFVDVSAHKHLWLVLALAAQFRTVARTRPQAVQPTPVVYEEAGAAPMRAGLLRVRPILRNGSST